MIRKISDIWAGLRLAGKHTGIGLLVCLLSLMALAEQKDNEQLDALLVFPLLALLYAVIGGLLIYRANSRYIIDTAKSTFTFPATDIENSILQIIIFAPFWNLFRRKTVTIESIENMYIDTLRQSKEKKKAKYRLNITGEFGSAQLEFLTKQKRDEVRSALNVAVKKVSGKSVDRKVSEFS